jgi:hypothetical protein
LTHREKPVTNVALSHAACAAYAEVPVSDDWLISQSWSHLKAQTEVGLYELSSVDPCLESACFNPWKNLKCDIMFFFFFQNLLSRIRLVPLHRGAV